MKALQWIGVFAASGIMSFLAVNLLPTTLRAIVAIAFMLCFLWSLIWTMQCCFSGHSDKPDAFKLVGFMLWVMVSPVIINMLFFFYAKHF